MAVGKLYLKWNDFQSCASQAFFNLQQEKDFFDVTLVTEDQVMFESHKVVLSASSYFFKNILRKNVHTHPLLYLHGIQSVTLQHVIDYVYQGEVKICQEEIEQFLAVASDLQILGLQEYGLSADKNEHLENDEADLILPTEEDDNDIVNTVNSEFEKKVSVENKVSITKNDTSIADLMEMISQMMEKVDGLYKCKVCKKETRDKTHLGRHIGSHIEGTTLTCGYCPKKFSSRESLRKHKKKAHQI